MLPKDEVFLPLSKDLILYTRKIGRCDDEVLNKFYEKAKHHEKAIMIASVEEGKFFQVLCRLIRAKRVLEVGVFLGYTTLALAKALPDDGEVVGLEISEEFPKFGIPFWKEAKVDKKIKIIYGDAAESIKSLGTTMDKFDFIFIDADKENYCVYLQESLSLIRVGGIIAIDNTLFFGRVLEDNPVDKNVIGVQKLNTKALELDPKEWDICCLPFADGVTLLTKL